MLKTLALLLALASSGWAVCPSNVIACYFCTSAQDGTDLCGGSSLVATGAMTYNAIAGPTVFGVQSVAVSGWNNGNHFDLPASIQAILTSTAKNNYSIEAYGQVANYTNFKSFMFNNANAAFDFLGTNTTAGQMRWGSAGGTADYATAIGQNVWVNLAYSYDGTNKTAYLAGVSDGTAVTNSTWNNGLVNIGIYSGGALPWDGYLSRIVIQQTASSVHPAVIAVSATNTDKRGLSLQSNLRLGLKP